MKVCFPVNVNEGLQSTIFGHFSSAPLFLLVDSESKEIEEVENCDPKDPFQGCNPLAALKDKGVEAIVVEGVADAVLQVMTNIHGFQFFATTTNNNLEETLEQLQNQKLQKIEPFYSQNEGRCGEDDEEDSCGHHHHEEDETPDENCVHHGGSGCSNHVGGSCTQH